MAVIEDIVLEVGNLALWLQALGVLTVIFLIFEVIAFLMNRKRLKEINVIKNDMKRIEGKINSLLKRKS
jgi:biopolymer transport protein ExbB/TolQ